MAAGKRIQRVNQLLKKELSQIILEEFDFPKNILVTLTRVQTAVNLIDAKIFVSVMPARIATQSVAGGSEQESGKIIKELIRNIGFIQQKINQRLKMKIVPKISFFEEKKTREAARIEELLEELKNEEK